LRLNGELKVDAIQVLFWWYGLLFSFLKNNEWIALWVEGLALVAIFYWDRKDAKVDHEETLEQITLARQQIAIGQKQVEASHNAERAWLITELAWQDEDEKEEDLFRWAERNRSKVFLGTSDGDKHRTSVMVRLRCQNSGRSPAWVERILGYCEIVDKPRNVNSHVGHEAQHLGWMEPLGPDTLRIKNITLQCPGHLTDNGYLAVFVLVEYRDIFGNRRATSCGYIVSTFRTLTTLRRQDERPERNVNT
jgi:hypothetical protein